MIIDPDSTEVGLGFKTKYRGSQTGQSLKNVSVTFKKEKFTANGEIIL
jgi:hypothetical protein